MPFHSRIDLPFYAAGFSLAATSLALAAPVGSVVEGLTATTLANLIRPIDVAKSSSDPFTKSPSQAVLDGRAFSLDIPLGRGRGAAGWSYDAETEVLTLRPQAGYRTDACELPGRLQSCGLGRSNYVEGYPFKEQVVSRSEYLGTNAFGATVKVKSTTLRRYAIIDFSQVPPTAKLFDEDATFKTTMSPDRARRLVPNLRLRLQGTVAPFDGRAVRCVATYEAPTFASPTTETARTCIVSVRLSSVSMVDLATGEVLARRERAEK